MKKGLTLTLMTVAVAMLGAQVMAMAPTIGEIPSPIIANNGTVSGPNQFVFPDAIDLRTYVTTDTAATTKEDIQWSYQISGTPDYEINGVLANPTNLFTPGSQQINTQAATLLDPDMGPNGKSSNGNIITVRNVTYSPITGTGASESGLTAGILTNQTQMVTFVASDGTTYATHEVLFYTSWGGSNRLSPSGFSSPTPVVTPITFGPGATNTNGWGQAIANSVGVAGSTNGITGTVNANGLCFTTNYRGFTSFGGTLVTADGLANLATYTTSTSPFTLVANAVYRIRVTLTGSNATAGTAASTTTVPFWDFQVQNNGYGCYGADWYILDAYGGANAVLTSGKTFDFWWTPPAVGTTQWNNAATGVFRTSATDSNAGFPGDATQVANMSPSLVFRFLENDATGAWERGGSVCLTNLQVDRWDLGQMSTIQTDWVVDSATNGGFAAASGASTGNVNYTQGQVGSWNVTFNGTMTIQPTGTTASETTGNGLGIQYAWAQSGSNTFASFPTDQPVSAYAGLSQIQPVPWKPNTLYQITATIAAAGATDALNPPDAILLGMDEYTNEVDMFSMAANTGGDYIGTVAAAPGALAPSSPTTTPSTYMAFFWSQTPSLGIDPLSGNTIPAMQGLQPILYILDTSTVLGRSGNKTGSLVISNFAVNEVSFP